MGKPISKHLWLYGPMCWWLVDLTGTALIPCCSAQSMVYAKSIYSKINMYFPNSILLSTDGSSVSEKQNSQKRQPWSFLPETARQHDHSPTCPYYFPSWQVFTYSEMRWKVWHWQCSPWWHWPYRTQSNAQKWVDLLLVGNFYIWCKRFTFTTCCSI